MGCKLSLDKVPKMVPMEESKYLIRKKDPGVENKQYTVVLDLDGTLGAWWKKEVRNGSTERSYMLFEPRPGLVGFLEEVAKVAEIVLWTPCSMEQARYAFAAADPGRHIAHIIYRDQRWFNPAKGGVKKRLNALGRNMDYTIAVDDSPMDINDLTQSIIVKRWDRRDADDDTLPRVLSMLKDLTSAKAKVAEYLCSTPLLRTITRKPHKYLTLTAPQALDPPLIDSVNCFQRVLIKGKTEPMGMILRRDKCTNRLIIKSVRPGTPAARCGFSAFIDCRILSVEGVPDPRLEDLIAETEGKDTVTFYLRVNLHDAPKAVATEPSLREKIEAPRDKIGVEFKDVKGKVYIWGMPKDSSLKLKPEIVGCELVYVDGIRFTAAADVISHLKMKKGPSVTMLEISNRAFGGSSFEDSSVGHTDPLSSSMSTTIASSTAFQDEFIDEGCAPITHLYQLSRLPPEGS